VVITLLESSKARLAHTELALQSQQVERERAEKLAAEAQLASLAARVQPHFLFNTLNSIAALIRENPRAAEDTVERLSSLLRGSLDGAETVPFDREMTLVVDYLEIQRHRFGDRLRYRIDWQEGAINRVTVPPFAVQSLVENSLKHVAAHRQEGVALEVTARVNGDHAIVEVTDDGPGFSPDAMRSAHGLHTLESRLRALYGPQSRLEFERAPNGMTVRFRVPA
jgi:two-component system, LytTR family, sensor histidine kinase AlgZ